MSMHVVQVSGYADPGRRSPATLLDAWPTLSECAQSVSGIGARVTVIQAAAESATIDQDGVRFRFVRVPGTRRGASAIAAAVRHAAPDAVHLHGMRFGWHARALRAALPDAALLVQDHADSPPRGPRAAAERRLLRGVDAAAFATAEQAAPFAPVLPSRVRIVEVPGTSTRFTPGDRTAARAAFGIGSEPCIAWVGRLAAVKLPLLALEVFRGVLRTVPDARLFLAFGEAALLPDVRRALDADEQLARRVVLLGRLERSRVELLLRACDVFLGTSSREGSGFAFGEALACGATAAVSDIPAFRRLADDGRFGRLFPSGDAAAGAAAVLAGLRAPFDRAAVRRHFEAWLSFDAVGRTLLGAYEDAARVRRRPHVALLVPGGVDRSGTERVMPCVLALVERLARETELSVIATRQEARVASYDLLGARVLCVPRRRRTAPLRALLRLHGERRADVLHALWMHPQGTTAALAGALLRVPVLVHLNGGDLAALPELGFGGRRSALGRLRLRATVAGARHVTAPSSTLAQEARALGIDAERLTLGVALDRWPPAAPRARPAAGPAHLLSVADINPVKDHATLLRAVATLVGRGRDVELDCVGTDTLGGSAARLAATLGLGARVRFHGHVAHGRVRVFFDRAHLLVVSSRYEGDPVAALEAAVAGVPVAGTHVGHLREWAPDAALTCEPGSAEALADCIDALLNNDGLRLRLARNAQQLALAHDADAAAARVLALYDHLCHATTHDRRRLAAAG